MVFFVDDFEQIPLILLHPASKYLFKIKNVAAKNVRIGCPGIFHVDFEQLFAQWLLFSLLFFITVFICFCLLEMSLII